jgi:hypothetical protein
MTQKGPNVTLMRARKCYAENYDYVGIKPFLVQRLSLQGVVKFYD